MDYEIEVEEGEIGHITIDELETGEFAIVIDEDSTHDNHYIVRTPTGAISLTNFDGDLEMDSKVRKIENATLTLTFGEGA